MPEAKGGPFVFWDGLEHACQVAKELGFDGIEIFAPGPDTLRDPVLASTVRNSGLSIAALGTGAGWVKHRLRLTDPSAEIRLKACAFLKEMLEAAASLGAPLIVGSMQGRWEGEVTKALAMSWLSEAFVALDRVASETGGAILIEPLNRYETNLLNRVEEAVDFIRRNTLSRTRVLADLFHMNIEESDTCEALRNLGSQLGHVHFADSNRSAMGMGQSDSGRIARTLRGMGFSGYVSAEVFPLPDSRTAAVQTQRAFCAHFG